MKHINESYANAVIKVFYNQIKTTADDAGISFDDYKKIFDMEFVNKCINLANDIFRHPGKYSREIAKSLKKQSFSKKKKMCMQYASALLNMKEEGY